MNRRWRSGGGLVLALALLVVHPDDDADPHSPVRRAAQLAAAGDLAGARSALALLPVERTRDPSALLVQVCMALEAGEVDTAYALLLEWKRAPWDPPPFEMGVLWELVKVRRQQPALSWSQAFARAWRNMAQPDFRDSRLLPPRDSSLLPEDVLARLWSQPLSDDTRVMLALAGRPDPERGRFLLEHLSDSRPPEFELFLLEHVLNPTPADAPRAQAVEAPRPDALKALHAHVVRLAAAHPDAMAPRFASVFLESPDTEPFTSSELEQLESLARLPRWRQTDTASLYRYAFEQMKDAGVSEPRVAALTLSMNTVVIPLFTPFNKKLRMSKQLSARDQQRLGQALQGIGESLSAENTLIEQLVGSKLLLESARLRGDAVAEQQVLAWRQQGSRLLSGMSRVELTRWPLHSLLESLHSWLTNNENEVATLQDFALEEQPQ